MNGKQLIACVMAAGLLIPASVAVVRTERTHNGSVDDRESMVPSHVRCDDAGAVDSLGRSGRLQQAIDRSRPGRLILVSGTCHEHVTVPAGKDGITLDGGGAASITGPDPTQITVLVRAKDVTIRGLTITGGMGGIAITQGGTGRIDGNTVRNTGGYGVGVSQLSAAVIVNNILQNNFQAGVGVAETSFAFIGFVTSTDTVASPNVITGNRAQGIAVFRGSYARIVGNEISQNGANGVNVRESSSAQISDNVINANGMNGILVAQGSGVLLGTDAGSTIFTRPNTTTANNVAFGIRCQVAGYTDGRLGSLNGASGADTYLEDCVPSLIR